jgi:hypothetical protein
MTSQTVERYEGTWRRLANISAGRKGSIHDDDAARGMGFRGGFVPGSTVGQAAMPAIIARLGQQWMEGGWYSFKFVRPVYIDEEVREVGSELLADGTLPLQVEARDGRLCCDRAAGLGATLPWDSSEDGTHGADEVFPAMTIGDAFAPSELHVVAEEVAAMIAAAVVRERVAVGRSDHPAGAADERRAERDPRRDSHRRERAQPGDVGGALDRHGAAGLRRPQLHPQRAPGG